MVIIMDDEDRENEGDLLMAAECVTSDAVNFMAKFGRGLICLTLTSERCRQLRLPLMVSGTDESHSTNFTVSIEAAEGVTTGISAADRATTVQAAVAPNARARRPGTARPYLPAHGAAGWGAGAGRTYRGGMRSGAPGGFRAGGSHRRDPQRGRHHGASRRISRSSPRSTV